MAVEAAVYARLAAVGSVTALVGTRIYPAPLPQGHTLPAVTYALAGGERPHAMGDDPGDVRSRVQVDFWAETSLGAEALYAVGLAALSRFHGTSGGVTVTDIFAGAPRSLYESDRKIHRRSCDFEVWYEEA